MGGSFSKDMVADDCEKVLVVHGSKAEVLDKEDAFIASLPPTTRVLRYLLRGATDTFPQRIAASP